MAELIDLLLHVDRYLFDLVANYGVWIYAILFVIVFAETGLVVTPFLPGDSLLFATGALAATGALNIWLAVILLLAAAVAGDSVNYAIGRSAGLQVIELSKSHPTWRRWINPDYIARAHDFFERQGGKAIVLGRFMPIVRTFVPFVAGVAGYLFGNVPVVKNNFSFVALGIVVVSLLPMAVEFVKYRGARAR